MEDDRGRSAERLITFTDAVVAIAITLLALPLTELPKDLDEGFGAYFVDKWPGILGFVISFFVIARLWWGHHRIFEHVVRWDRVLVVVTILWLFTIVLLAPITAVTTSNTPEAHPDVIAVYIGVMVVSSGLLSVLSRHVVRRPDLTDGHDLDARRRLFTSVETTIGFAVALVIGTVFPQVNYFALLVLALSGRIGRVIQRRAQKRLNIR